MLIYSMEKENQCALLFTRTIYLFTLNQPQNETFFFIQFYSIKDKH